MPIVSPRAPTAGAGVAPAVHIDPTGLGSAIVGIGSFLPDDLLSNADLEAMVDTSDSWIMERTGIRHRHRVGAGETASAMGAIAARRAIAAAGSPRIDAIICCTCSPDTLLPSTACLIQRSLGLAGQPAFDLNAACSGFVYGVTIADGMIRSGIGEHILLVTSEAMTSLVDYGDRATCVLFGDGAAAVVLGVSGTARMRAARWGADGGEADLIYYGPMPDDESSPDRLRMAGRGTFRLAVERLCGVALDLCDDAGWAIGDIDHIVPHQANQRIIEAASRRLEVPLEKVVVNVGEVGNTSAASIGLALDAAHRDGTLAPGDRVLCMAFGSGATWGGVALEWTMPCPR